MNQDMVRKQKKYRRTWISFAVILFLLLLVFFSAINTGSLSVSFGQLLRGLFVEYVRMWRRSMICVFRVF